MSDPPADAVRDRPAPRDDAPPPEPLAPAPRSAAAGPPPRAHEPAASDLSGDWEYLSEAYYRLQDAELAGDARPLPTCAEALDAYVVPIALQKAEAAGLAVPEWFLANEWFPVNVVVYGVNPFNRSYAVVRTEEQQRVAAKRLTWRYKYTVCCERIADATAIVEFRAVGGRADRPEFAGWADAVLRVFRLPLAKVRLLRTGDRLELSALEKLPWKALTRQERAAAEEFRRTTLA